MIYVLLWIFTGYFACIDFLLPLWTLMRKEKLLGAWDYFTDMFNFAEVVPLVLIANVLSKGPY